MMCIVVGVFHLHSFQLHLLAHPSSSAAHGVRLKLDGKPVFHFQQSGIGFPLGLPGEHPSSYVNSELWKKHTNANAQSSSSNVPVVGLMSSSSTSAQSMPTSRPTPSCAPTLATVAEQDTEPEATPPTSAIPQSADVPVPQAFPYITHTVDSDRDDVQVIARHAFWQHIGSAPLSRHE